uniref:Uncharacterized protein n=1 Tax=Ditylenchus dipsaci TaxID=166011 RepID=A0A915DHE6_9BILA
MQELQFAAPQNGSAKKNQRVKAAHKTRKHPSLRKSISVQVDITSSIIAKLQEEKKALLCRLVEPKTKKITPRKAIQHLSWTASLQRIDQVAGMFLTKSGDRPSYEEFKRDAKTLQRRLGIVSPEKPERASTKLSPLEDLKLPWKSTKERRNLKSATRKSGKDIFAATNQVQSLARGFADDLKTESAMIEDSCYIWLLNIKEVLVKRCLRLKQTKNLNFGGPFERNVQRANSPDSLLLVALYDDDDKHDKLANLHQVFEQLEFHRLSLGTTEREVVWFVTGDLKFLDSIYDHIGSSATHPCVLCEAPKSALKGGSIFKTRTLSSINECFSLYQRKTEGRSSSSNSEKTALHRQSLSIAKQPLVKIPIENVIPPSLHIIQGLCQNVIDRIEKREPLLVKNRKRCSKVSVHRNRPATEWFSGNHCRKLLAGDGPKRIADVIAGNSKHSAVEELLTVSGTTVRADKSILSVFKNRIPRCLCHFESSSAVLPCGWLCPLSWILGPNL